MKVQFLGHQIGHMTNGLKKNKYPWLIFGEGKIGCMYCKSLGSLKLYKKQGVEISNDWCLTKIDGGTNSIKATRLANLRHKITKHKNSNAHTFAAKIVKVKNCNILSNAFQTGCSNLCSSTEYIFRTTYFIAKCNRPFDDHSKLIELQQLNGVKLGTTLHSRYSSTMIISHIA